MTTSYSVFGAGLLAALFVAGGLPLPATAGDVTVIVSAHPKVHVIAGDNVPKHDVKAYPRVRVIGGNVPKHGVKARPRVRVIDPYHPRSFVLDPPSRRTVAGHPVSVHRIDKGWGVKRNHHSRNFAHQHPRSFTYGSAPPLHGKVAPKLATPTRHGLQGLPAGSRFLHKHR